MHSATDQQNGGRGRRPVIVHNDENWRAFDALPKRIREALIEAPFDYAATMVLAVWNEIWDEEFRTQMFPSHLRAEAALLDMLRQNINNDMREYNELLANIPAKTLTYQTAFNGPRKAVW